MHYIRAVIRKQIEREWITCILNCTVCSPFCYRTEGRERPCRNVALHVCISRWWYENTCGKYVLYARLTMTSCTYGGGARQIRTGAAGWERLFTCPILACLARSVLLHACMRRPVSRSGLLGEPVDGSIGVGDDGWNGVA